MDTNKKMMIWKMEIEMLKQGKVKKDWMLKRWGKSEKCKKVIDLIQK